MLQYTFDWMVMGKSNIYRAKTAKQALKIIKRFKQKAEFSNCLFVSIGKANEPSYSAKMRGFYFKNFKDVEWNPKEA